MEGRRGRQPAGPSHACEHAGTDSMLHGAPCAGDMEIEGLDDEHDVAGVPVCSEQRIMKLFDAIKDVRLRGEVMQWMPPANFREHFTPAENPPVEPEKPFLNPRLSNNDLRAISEKRRWKAIMDTEWRRRQALVGRLQYPDPYQDVRLDGVAEEVSGPWNGVLDTSEQHPESPASHCPTSPSSCSHSILAPSRLAPLSPPPSSSLFSGADHGLERGAHPGPDHHGWPGR